MDYPTVIFFAVFAFIAGSYVFRRLKYGSWTGAFLKGSIERTIGEVELASGMGSSQKLTIQLMKGSSNGEEFVGLVVVSKAMLAASMQPYRLSKIQARELASYLDQAAQ